MKRLSTASFRLGVAPESGADATVYWLVPSATQIKRKADGTHLPEYVSCESMAKTGDDAPVSGIGTIKFVFTYKSGSTSAEFIYASRIIVTADMAGVSFRLYVGGQVLDEKTVLVVDDGEEGKPGGRGRMPFPAGIFDAGTTYTATDDVAPIVYYEPGKTYYVMNKSVSVTGVNPADDYARNGNNATWIPFENYKAIFTEILMADFAKLASAVFRSDYMFSQHGKDTAGNDTSDYSLFEPEKVGQDDAAFTPNTLVDWLSGTIRTKKLIADGAELTNVKGLTGTFSSLQGVDKNNKVKCAIGFNASQGKMYFEGDMQHQGYDYEKDRTHRFLTADLWCRGRFGAAERTVLEVRGSYGYFYTKGLSKSGVYVSLVSGTSSANETYYNVPCFGLNGDYAGMPVDIVVFTNSYSYANYRLVMYDSQRVLVVNANNNHKVYIYSHGNKVVWEGGELAEVVSLPSMAKPAQADNILGRGLFIGAFRDNNW